MRLLLGGDNNVKSPVEPLIEGTLGNPAGVRIKGCGPSSSTQNTGTGNRKIRKAPTCGICGRKCHNRKSCIVQKECHLNSNASNGFEDDELYHDSYYANVDMLSVNYLLIQLHM